MLLRGLLPVGHLDQMSSGKKDLAKYFKRLRSCGCIIRKRRRSNHWSIRLPNGRQVFTASTPGDNKGLLNLKQDLRRNGFNPPD